MPARNRTTVSDVPVHAMLAMISNPAQYGKMIEEFSRAETSAKLAESVARDRENAAGDAEILIAKREEAVTRIEEQQAKREADLLARNEHLTEMGGANAAARRVLDAERQALEVEKTAFTERYTDLQAAASAFMAAGA